MNFILDIFNKKNTLDDVIDKKQQFASFKSEESKKKFLYEFNIKTKLEHSSEKQHKFLEKLELFSPSDNVGYMIFYVSIPDTFLHTDLKGWHFFKLTIGLNKKKSLNVVRNCLNRKLDDKMEIFSDRIVENKQKVDCEEYFSELTTYLVDTYPYVYPRERLMMLKKNKENA